MTSIKKYKFPTAHSVLFVIAAFVALLTWIIPAGQYDRLSYDSERDVFIKSNPSSTETFAANQQTLDDLNVQISLEKFVSGAISKPISVPDTYKHLESSPQGPWAFVQAPLKGIVQVADIILLVLIIGGLIAIVNASGAFVAGISWLSIQLQGREFLLIVIVTCLIALGGTTFGLEEETIAFYPILIPIFLAAKYDALVAIASIYLGSSIGTLASTVNPFSTIIASDAAGINWTTGIESRVIMLVVGLIVSIVYILRYASRIKKTPSKSLIYDQRESIAKMFQGKQGVEVPALSWRLRLILLVFSLCFIVMVYGVSQLGWWFMEMTSVFLVGALIIGLISRIGEKEFVTEFIQGASDLLGVAFIIGIARGVTILMEDGLVSDTLLFYASTITDGMPKGIFINAILLIYSGLTFFISSSSGMAVLSMPIMAPLADSAGIEREVMVNAYQYGVGLFKIINPTGIILASLAIVNVGYDRWLKFAMPLVGILCLLAMLSLTLHIYL